MRAFSRLALVLWVGPACATVPPSGDVRAAIGPPTSTSETATRTPSEDQLARKAAGQGKPVSRVIFGKYDAGDPRKLAAGLERDLHKIFTWQNVWRVAGSLGARDDEGPDLKFEVLRLKDKRCRESPSP